LESTENSTPPPHEKLQSVEKAPPSKAPPPPIQEAPENGFDTDEATRISSAPGVTPNVSAPANGSRWEQLRQSSPHLITDQTQPNTPVPAGSVEQEILESNRRLMMALETERKEKKQGKWLYAVIILLLTALTGIFLFVYTKMH